MDATRMGDGRCPACGAALWASDSEIVGRKEDGPNRCNYARTQLRWARDLAKQATMSRRLS